MEDLVTDDFWRGRRVLVTGHTGFKGSWLVMWLRQMGAEVTGFALAPEDPGLFGQARVDELCVDLRGDIRNLAEVEAAVGQARPELVLHLAAQPIVRLSYDDPVGTFATNVQGTVHVLDACRRNDSVKAILCVTSDKCYENREWVWPYRENDPMGGHDPYSSSKGAAELVISAYRRSFFSQGPLLASVRAGNVIGGGDWARDRLIPDIIRAMIAGERPLIRAPGAIRPWQHVLEALGGYLMIAWRMLQGDAAMAAAWNFGPADSDTRPVGWIVDRMVEAWGGHAFPDAGWDRAEGPQPHEANLLKLDCAKARAELGWRPAFDLEMALDRVVGWHRAVADGADARLVSNAQLDEYRALLAQTLAGKAP